MEMHRHGKALAVKGLDNSYTHVNPIKHETYSALDPIPYSVPGAQRDVSTRETGLRPSSNRLIVVGLGLVCTVLLTTIVALIFHYNRVSFSAVEFKVELEHLRDKYNIVITAKDQLQRDHTALNAAKHQLERVCVNLATAKDQLQRDYINLTVAKDQLQRNYINLTATKDQLQRDYTNLIAAKNQSERDCISLTATKDQLQRNYTRLTAIKDQLQQDYINLTAAKDQLQRDYISLTAVNHQLNRDYIKLSEAKAILTRVYVGTTRERDRLRRTLAELVNYLPVDRYCPVMDPNTQERLCRPCLKGWKLFSSRCYYFSTERKSWIDSRIDCLQQGADLLTIQSAEEQEFVHRHTSQYNSPRDRYWIGLTDESEIRGSWVWVDGTRLNEGYWIADQPRGWNEKCASTLRASNPMKSWDDNICSLKFRWICESKALILSA